ncbi:MAG: DNA repair protein RecN [Immundisolibacter sp.]|uniref:DNA repair protein RecN n=1 Tax=Immundisolibacter sp. TaxID=1934948 RepID=UPI003EE307F1
MLVGLRITNFAIVEAAELEFDTGFTAVTGETGAGKSLVVDALLLSLGERAGVDVIRAGCEQADVTAAFDVAAVAAAQAWLQANDLADGSDCIVRRTVRADGRSRSYVNGRPVAAGLLRELGQQLVDIHGQHAYQALLRPQAQRALLDRYAGTEPLLAEVAAAYEAWQLASRALDAAAAASAGRAERLDLLRYQLQELDALALAPDEWPQLDAEQRRAGHAQTLAEGGAAALRALDEDSPSAYALLAQAAAQLSKLCGYDERLSEIVTPLDGALVQVGEASSALRHYLDAMDIDPARARWLEDRVGAAMALARKHQVPPMELAALHQRLRAELDLLDDEGPGRASLEQAKRAAWEHYQAVAAALTEARGAAAERLAPEVTDCINGLGMPGASFDALLLPLDSGNGSAAGAESVEFRIRANAGDEPRSLARVASGGELSRISLGIHTVTLAQGEVPTLVFDEVDVGIGGAVAETVGRLLRALGGQRQVLCITHLPQVAALARNHLRVSKHADQVGTVTAVEQLPPSARVDEIARMLGGVTITERTRAHAAEMLTAAQRV